MQIQKRFRSAYVLDEAKLRRILGVVEQTFAETGADYTLRFEATHPQRRVTTVNSLEELLLLDNSKKHPIESLTITAVSEDKDSDADTSPSRRCQIVFDDAEFYAAVDYRVASADSKWANNCSTLLVEQIERTFQGSWVTKINGNSPLRMAMIPLLLALLVALPLSFLEKSTSGLSSQMWLTDSNITEIVTSAEPLEPAEVLSMQIRNIQGARGHSKLEWLKDWRVYAAFSPLLVVLICLGYLAFRCYPPTVFNWGDMGEHYETLLGRRKLLWSAVLIGVFVGLLSNLAVYGLVDLTKH